jgi:hypothetical protein
MFFSNRKTGSLDFARGTRWTKLKAAARRNRSRTVPHAECLEGRTMLSTFHVNITGDSLAMNLKSGQDSSGHVSLRSAIEASNARGGSNTIVVPQGTLLLSLKDLKPDGTSSVELGITKGTLDIKGAGIGRTIIDAQSLDRVLEVLGGKVTLSGLTIQNGKADIGGGILKDTGSLTLSQVQVTNNVAIGTDGLRGFDGINTGKLQLPNGGNGLAGSAGQGGGIFNAAGSLSLTNSLITSNRATGGRGGNGGSGLNETAAAGLVGTNGGNATGGNGGAGGAGADGQGGGLFNAAGATLSLSGTTILGNTARGGDGGTGGRGGDGNGGNGGNGVFNSPGDGGLGVGGEGGDGGAAGRGEGGGLFNLGRVTAATKTDLFASNTAIGGVGGGGELGGNGNGGAAGNVVLGSQPGGTGGGGFGGIGGRGGRGGDGSGGGVFNGTGATFASTTTVNFNANLAAGNFGGTGDDGRLALGGVGGNGGANQVDTGAGGTAEGGTAGAGGIGGVGQGGGLFNQNGATVSFGTPNHSKPAPASAFTGNHAVGGEGGQGGEGGGAASGAGGNATGSRGGNGGTAFGGKGGAGGAGNEGAGGGLFNAGAASFLGVTLSVINNQAEGASGGKGGKGGNEISGQGGNAITTGNGGHGGDIVNSSGGNGGVGGTGIGGGLFDANTGTLVIKPRLGAKKGSSQAKATDTITLNDAGFALGATGGAVGIPVLGIGGTPNGHFGTVISNGTVGTKGSNGVGVGGGIAIIGTATIDDTNITGNHASNNDDDVDGTFSM